MAARGKWLTATMAGAVLLASLAACSKDNNDSGSEASPSGGGSATDAGASALQMTNGKIEPTVTLTTVRGEDPTATFKNGETYADNVHTRWAAEKLGVDVKTLWSSPVADGSYDTKLKLMLSGGDKLPDVFVSTNPTVINTFIESGKVMDIGEAFDKYASATYKAAMDEVPSVWQPFMKDGKKFAIPVLRPTMGTQSSLWIRQDWLDKLGLKAPTTIEEFEQVMDAFVNKDPDGNGKKDTVALDFGMKDTFTGYPVGDTSWIFGMFGAIPEIWYPGEDGKLQYGSIQPGIKTALAKIKEWKDKGYIANDIALHDFNKVSENVISGKVGMLGGANWLVTYPGGLLAAKDPKAIYMPYALPQGENGKNMRTVSTAYTGAILISKDISNEALQAFFHYMNYMYSVYDQTDPQFFKGYQDGYDYLLQDGNVVTDEKQIPGGKVQTMKYTLVGGQILKSSTSLDAAKRQAMGEAPTNEDLIQSAPLGVVSESVNPLERIVAQATLIDASQPDADVRDYFQGPATSTMTSRNELLKKMQMDTYTDIIYGKESPDAFDAYVKKWKSSGGDDITKEVNEWYDSVK